MIWTTSTTTFHNLWYGGFVNLPHGLLRNPFLRDHFDNSHNLLLDLRDCHVHNSFNGALLITRLWDQSHNFTDLLHDWRNIISRHLRLAVWTQHRRSSFLRTSINSLPDLSTYCTSTRRTCTTAFAVKTVKLQQAARNLHLSEATFWVLLLIDSSSITLFLCASLGPGAFSLAHCGSCLVDRGQLDAFTASFTAISPQRSSALCCILSRVLAVTREYASCARREPSVHHCLSLKAVSPFTKSKTIHAV